MKVVYITSSSYSGSTLLTFLLNTHPKICTAGEMEGWAYSEPGSFLCSCGRPLEECPLFLEVQRGFRRAGLPFAFNEFGTAYRLTTNERVNRYLCGSLPFGLSATPLESARDTLVQRLPVFSGRLRRQDHANRVFMKAAVDYAGAEVFLDATKDPYRLRRLGRIPELDIYVIHLVRDLRGVVLSDLESKKRRIDASQATQLWIKQQQRILRVLPGFRRTRTLFYEDLCDSVEPTLAGLYEFIGLEPSEWNGDFRSVEHHVLGNSMRLGKVGTIVKSERWRTELSATELGEIERTAADFARSHPSHGVSRIVTRYLDGDPHSSAR